MSKCSICKREFPKSKLYWMVGTTLMVCKECKKELERKEPLNETNK